jgi:hypothetical protein
VPVTPPEQPHARCWRCERPVAPDDHYCRACGEGQGAFLSWTYRPLWIAVLALTLLGPLVLPLVWRTPRLDRTGKWVWSLAIVGLTAWVAWELAGGVSQLASLLGGP